MTTELLQKMNIDKSNWALVKFGDVVFEPKENMKDASAEGILHVVGLEHIDSGDIHLRKSASIEDSTTFTKKFKKFDVLFGRRRAYLKKAAQASFDGICSGDITVFRAKENVLPEILPFIVNNDNFFDYAVKHSAGGLSPRVKFRDLEEYKFLLPSKEEQKEIAKLLWAMDEVIEKEKENRDKYNIFYQRYLFDTVSGKVSKNRWREYVFGELGNTFGGLTGKTKDDFGIGAPFVTYMNVFSNTKINPNQVEYVKIDKGENQNELRYGDILLTGSSETPHEVGMSSVVLDNLKGFYLNSFCFGFRLHDFKTLLPEYARYLMRGNEVRTFMSLRAQGSTRFNLSKTIVRTKLKVRLPKINEQKEIVLKLEKFEDNLISFQIKIESSQSLQKSIINQIF
ncbi:restriction endonuclease subunit S [Flavobacterium sp. DG2-3]|uniref:restriction endonuclease subunit S n=1 Tax=Flavobacterium sp. DG2-3 TaxID=3068317 RepID=UPI00273E687D|nr:restriction endonuclease subunit S [Flavobacterium sp. DG2-3]MDP5201229.1 restriction endonuclease subunit S [Flavobacterium sp. DG2-3]